MDKNDKNERLRKALEECLNEEIRMVPPKRELERRHEFSRSFEKNMQKMTKKRKKKKAVSLFIKIAACLFLFFVVRIVGDSFYVKEKTNFDNSVLDKDSVTQERQNNGQTHIEIAEKNQTKEGEIYSPGGQKEQDSLKQYNQIEEQNGTSKKNEKTKDDKQDTNELEDEGEEEENESSDENIISNASVKDKEEQEIVSQLVSAVLDGETAKITVHIENKTEDTISCVNENKLQVLEDGSWISVEAPDGTISNEEKEIVPGEVYQDETVITGYDLESGKQYKMFIAVGGEQKEIVFGL
ncbi:immunoglobulin-like domain-containing protein [Velocimicrobium porci]|uniref:DUF4352 domain-containing protein n=1 Tax=Velocimicrobium porci TaxID=2606634 RepID=A0A6L5XXX3_9FIRM|nr:hypothetical protein [Velocimicrobium porci]MSS63494.1 hypothetical protein [Velocimicrobium porci]